MKNKKLTQDKVVYFVNYILLTLLMIIVLYPLIYVVSCSFSSGEALMAGRVKFLPVEPTLLSYKTVFNYGDIWIGYLNSIIYTLIGTVISIVLTLLAAYPLSRSDFRGGNVLMKLFLFTMMFNGGLVPTYLLVRNLGLIDTIWAVVLPTAVNAYNIIVARTFFRQTISKDLQEAAELDGCSDFMFFVKIVIPLSMSIIAVLCLWVVIALWNGYFYPLIYINSQEKYPLQLILRRILLMSQVDFGNSAVDPKVVMENQYLSQMLRYGTIIISSLPLLLIYPFVQKHFVKGVMIGSVKG